MEKARIRRIVIYCVLAILLFTALFLATFQDRRNTGDKIEVQIVAFGDSVFGLIRDETAVPARVQALTGKTLYNAAFGGTCVARQGSDDGGNDLKDSFSLVGLAKAVWAEDFGVQQCIRIRESNTEYFAEVVDYLAAIDFSKVETVLIQQGLNDYHAGLPIDAPEDPYNEHTFLGALRSSVYALKKANPNIRIVLVTPTYAWYLATGQTCEEADQGGGKLSDYVEAEIKAAQELEVELLDVYNDFYPHENWEDWELYTFDGVHPNEEGRKLLAERIAEILD